MENNPDLNPKPKQPFKNGIFWTVILLALMLSAFFSLKTKIGKFNNIFFLKNAAEVESAKESAKTQLDFIAYDKKLNEIAAFAASSTLPALWPVKTVYPNDGAILPFNRIVAYYGNLYSKNMGILGEYSEDEVLRRLGVEIKKWEAADSATPVVPALHYIAVVAQAGPGRDGKYRARMPDKEIDKVLKMAEKINALVFLDIQAGLSDLEAEIPLLEKYLKLPQVHLGIDPEFYMKTGARPGTAIGALDAEDINFTANFLAKIVKENNLTPKVLIIHRFTQKMVTNYKNIKPLPEAQIVMNMDGFGGQANKLNTYKQYIYKEPVQFTGFKLFYGNDAKKPGSALLTPGQLLKLTPIPVYIQYQ